ncbi:MAG: hypothetical protein RL637_1466 [Pseudomonadota bacterium]|jgi:hypothetical protein
MSIISLFKAFSSTVFSSLYRLKAAFFTTTLIRIRQQQLQYRCYHQTEWQSLTSFDQLYLNRFSTVILLLPTIDCSFQQRYFPQHLLSEAELAEAVHLDIAQWSPWTEAVDYFFNYQLIKQNWQVDIWVWPRSMAHYWRQQLPYCTHILPEIVWYSGQLKTADSLLIHRENQHYYYALVNPRGYISQLFWITHSQQIQRYWHSWGLPKISHFWLTENIENDWYPNQLPQPQLFSMTGKIQPHWLKLTRLSDSPEWTNPWNYQRSWLLIIAAFILWMIADTFVLSSQLETIQSQLQYTRKIANHALQLRQQVQQQHSILHQLQTVRYQQQLPLYLIAILSQRIPENIWITHLQLQQDQLDLNGQGKQVLRLLALLEQISGVRQVLLLNDIRPDPQTGEELFQIRLILNHSIEKK